MATFPAPTDPRRRQTPTKVGVGAGVAPPPAPAPDPAADPAGSPNRYLPATTDPSTNQPKEDPNAAHIVRGHAPGGGESTDLGISRGYTVGPDGMYYTRNPDEYNRLIASGVPRDKIMAQYSQEGTFTTLHDPSRNPLNDTYDAIKGGVKDVLGGMGVTGAPLDGAGVAADAQVARDMRQQFGDQLAGYQFQPAPEQQRAQVGPVQQATGAAFDPLATAGTAQATGAQLGPAAQAGVTQAAGGNLGAAAQAGPVERAQTAQINMGPQAELRARQMALADATQAAMNGQAPSVAAQLLKQGADRNIAQQYALAASARGQNVGLAARNAAQGAATIGAQQAADAALLRAKEITDARAQLGGLLEGVRGADVNLATSQAGFENQTGMFNAGEANNTSRFNVGQVNDQERMRAQLAQQLGIANAGFSNEASMFNAGQTNDLAAQRAQLEQQLSTFNAGQSNQVGMFNAGAQNERSALQAQLAQQLGIANAGFQNTAGIAQANLDNSAFANSLQAYMQGKQLSVQEQENLRQAMLAASGQSLTAQTEMAKAEALRQGAMLSAGSSILAGLVS